MTTAQNATLSSGGEVAPVRVGELTIDPETGEVLETTVGSQDAQINELTRVCAEAQRVLKDQEVIYNAARAALLRLLTESGRRSVKTPYGTPTLRQQTRRSGRPDRVLDAVRRYELSRDQEQVIWQTATALDVKELEALAEAGVLPADAVADIVEIKAVSYVQLVPARTAEG